MEYLIDAVYNTFAANSTLTTKLGDRFYFDEGVQNATYPYCVWFINSKTRDDYMPATTSTNKVEEYAIQFNIWDNQRKRTRITGIESDMLQCFDDTVMTVTGYSNEATIPGISHIMRDPNERWQLTMEYRVRLRKT